MDYSRLPTLVLNEIFGYLSVKDRIKCKSVCRAWRTEVELREKNRDLLVLHIGPYLWNLKWTLTNNGSLMKYENSFEMKHLNFLEHPMTKRLLSKIKKLALVNHSSVFDPNTYFNLSDYTDYLYFNRCEEIEIRNFPFPYGLEFDLPNLKTLVLKDSPANDAVLNCPSLETLFCNWKLKEIQFYCPTKLKRFFCYGWPAKVLLQNADKLESLEYLNLVNVYDNRVGNRLLGFLPNLKRLSIYSSDLQADLEIIRRQQARLGLKELEVLFYGFSEPIKLGVEGEMVGFVALDQCVDQLFDNYAKLVENSFWRVRIEYSALFSKFKILPANFFERFNEVDTIEISQVTSYRHLFGFLACYPFINSLNLHFSKVKANLILDFMHLQQPSLREVTIIELRAVDTLDIDLTFLRLFNIVSLRLDTNRSVPAQFIRKVAAKRGSRFAIFTFVEISTGHHMTINFLSNCFLLCDLKCGETSLTFSSIDELIAGWRNDRHMRLFLQ